ncbi:MAG: hypothetical protein KF729_15210 [Sandaracinaceae bacterium]|nr:hypothetical protein [Sandaracinaceae bacterium]
MSERVTGIVAQRWCIADPESFETVCEPELTALSLLMTLLAVVIPFIVLGRIAVALRSSSGVVMTFRDYFLTNAGGVLAALVTGLVLYGACAGLGVALAAMGVVLIAESVVHVMRRHDDPSEVQGRKT